MTPPLLVCRSASPFYTRGSGMVMRPPIARCPRTLCAYLKKFFFEQNRNRPVQIGAQYTDPRPFIALQHLACRVAEAVAVSRRHHRPARRHGGNEIVARGRA